MKLQVNMAHCFIPKQFLSREIVNMQFLNPKNTEFVQLCQFLVSKTLLYDCIQNVPQKNSAPCFQRLKPKSELQAQRPEKGHILYGYKFIAFFDVFAELVQSDKLV